MIDYHEDDPLLLRDAPLWYRVSLGVVFYGTLLVLVGGAAWVAIVASTP